jgi:hypothetical protein
MAKPISCCTCIKSQARGNAPKNNKMQEKKISLITHIYTYLAEIKIMSVVLFLVSFLFSRISLMADGLHYG